MNCFVVHYHEIALKKGNRRFFVDKLAGNIKAALKEAGYVDVQKLPGRLLLSCESPISMAGEKLEKIPGIANFVSAFEMRTMHDIVFHLKDKKFETFRVSTKRSDKTFPKTSEEMNREIGALVQKETGAGVDLENPDLIIYIEVISKDKIFFGFEKIQGVGGLPVGSSGKVVSLISGGIDSPVASYMAMKRGCRVVFVNFHSFPYLDKTSQEKVAELVKILDQHQQGSKLYSVPFGDIQKEVVLSMPEKYRVIIYRRLMLKIAERIAKKENAKALVTGESLGQVASQTLENMSVVGRASELLVLRPLVGMDKEEIIKISQKIGTYDISIIPDQDCCQLFTPSHPATMSDVVEVEKMEQSLDIEKFLEMCDKNLEKTEI